MKIHVPLAIAASTLLLVSCATPQPPQAFHNSDNSALVIQSIDDKECKMLKPAATPGPESNRQILQQAGKLSQHQTAVVILENYTELKPGHQFQDRGTPLFVELRFMGYQHIVFLQGRGQPNPEGLFPVAEYF